MSAIKFSKQTIHPNPKEVDYWVDISKNPYGNVIKYFNGQDWVDLAYTGGLPDLSSYYTKVQVNELLNKKADAVEVDKLVSDEEIANVINNISFTTSNPNSVDLVKFNFDGTKVAVTLPIASNTTAGIVSSDDFKDFVKQWQLQKLYIEMYDLFADIRAKYQRKLKAGLNIHIDEETDTISTAGDLSVMWDNLLGKPDFDQLFTDVYTTIDEEEDRAKAEEERLGQRITDHVDVVKAELNLKADKKDMYTKDQVDQKVASVYRVIGSSTFEELPTEGNTIGDVYNITNDFTLNGVEYPFGTNLVWTADGWDTLSGVFDTTELEGMVEAVDTKVDEEILRAKAAELNIQTQLDAEIKRAKESEESIETAYKTADTTLQNNIDTVDGKLVNYLPLNDNAVSATKLQTPRTIWGQSFDGSKNIDGNIQISNNSSISFANSSNTQLQCLTLDSSNKLIFGYGTSSRGYDTYIYGKNIYFRYGSSSSNVLTIDDDGTVGIGSYYPSLYYKLIVGGNVKSDAAQLGDIMIGMNYRYSTDRNVIETSYSGSSLYLQKNHNGNIYMCSAGGNVGIGATSAKYKLDVNGPLNATTIYENGTSLGSKYLPLSGGTITSTNTIPLNISSSSAYASMRLSNENNYRTFGINPNGDLFVTDLSGWNNEYVIFHSGNLTPSDILYRIKQVDGAGSGLDADTVDGYNVGTLLTLPLTAQYVDNLDSAVSNRFFYSGFQATNGPGANYATGITLYNDQLKYKYQFAIDTFGNAHIRYKNDTTWQAWKQLAFTDSNVASATKLETPRTIWGQSFDGSGDIAGTLTSNTTKSNYIVNYSKYYVGGQFYANNLSAGDEIGVYVGKSYTEKRVAYMSYHQGENDNETYATFGLHSVDKAIVIKTSGNVGIGTTSPAYKLDVKGNVSGDFVDWYGVEWTDSQSDPALTRIGNMSYHRSLPVQSGMKGYTISNKTDIDFIDQIKPLTDDWTKIKYGGLSNDTSNHNYFTSINVMVKIPEYWYIHEYDETTGTHQLKLSQTAKAGWLHHKEAYVGAYEGYDDGTYYRSIEGQVPTVSVTRETIRGLARANGYEDEYKWNIYTYEEHKAICHLFMVEYATRNSQAAVNTELTADGFKQGGLGSGCTSGSVTIGGATKHSFIPTGVTDSLGNGSGQVAYTVTQTDADGNETGTVTRYANRYRGIENPFGHIWKYCDDVISQYNSVIAYRIFYKCDKPEHFATNKNTKYRPVCCTPVAEGYKKTLKHTIGLDLFSYEVGGSASTYWCDYNYDNTGTAEHCLLIGGRSNSGTLAGLFYLSSSYGVGSSDVYFGSRLTYLPWAE